MNTQKLAQEYLDLAQDLFYGRQKYLMAKSRRKESIRHYTPVEKLFFTYDPYDNPGYYFFDNSPEDCREHRIMLALFIHEALLNPPEHCLKELA